MTATSRKAPQSASQPGTFAATLAEWDRRLADDGFRDIESRSHGHLLVDHPDAAEVAAHAARAAYLDACRDYWRRNRHRLKGRSTRRIWRLHSEGTPYRDIAAACRCSLGWVANRIDYVRRKMERAQRAATDRGRNGWQVAARFTDAEAAMLQRWSAEVGVTPTELVRRLVLAGGTTSGIKSRVAKDSRR